MAIDAEGNVTGLRPGSDPDAGLIVLCSHLDTVFPAGTDVTVKRKAPSCAPPASATTRAAWR
ncbi:hypothetical protein ACFQU7_09380 [Pseudoroseomonas wenyumeiae]